MTLDKLIISQKKYRFLLNQSRNSKWKHSIFTSWNFFIVCFHHFLKTFQCEILSSFLPNYWNYVKYTDYNEHMSVVICKISFVYCRVPNAFVFLSHHSWVCKTFIQKKVQTLAQFIVKGASEICAGVFRLSSEKSYTLHM